jgi:organic hydroperoxide reductase OsmC/OhrA
VKPDKQFLFETQLNWVSDAMGVLSANHADGVIQTATSSAFGGKGRHWSPQHLFLGAVISDFMTTFLAYSAKQQLPLTHFECNAIGAIKVVEHKYQFTQIDLWPKVFIAGEQFRDTANEVVLKTHGNCLVANSLKADIYFHTMVLVEPVPKEGMRRQPPAEKQVPLDEAREIGIRLGIDFETISLTEFRKGLETEAEHGSQFTETNITNDNKYITGKMAWAHLREIPDYYSRLELMEKKAGH